MGQMENKVALVTGAASGIGRQARLRWRGKALRSASRISTTKVARRLPNRSLTKGGQAIFAHCDVTKSDDVRRDGGNDG